MKLATPVGTDTDDPMPWLVQDNDGTMGWPFRTERAAKNWINFMNGVRYVK
ncbi:hypothetical protein D3C81_1330510 [compost metagenome]